MARNINEENNKKKLCLLVSQLSIDAHAMHLAHQMQFIASMEQLI